MARRRSGRNISGFLLLDKPAGPTSNQALQRVRRLLDASKAGHTGTLDPMATGMLPVCCGAATKVAGLAIQAGKHYETTGRLGAATETGDSSGSVVGVAEIPELDADAFGAVLQRFSGVIEQVPPRYSAIRHEGRRLYELARKGIQVEASARKVTIHSIELIDVAWPEFTLRVHCSKGTYIRTLVEDIGRELGSLAHVTALRRTGVDPFVDQQMVSFEDLEAVATPEERAERFLLPVDLVLMHWPQIEISHGQAQRIRLGQRIALDAPPETGSYRIYEPSSSFIGIGEITSEGELRPKRIFL